MPPSSASSSSKTPGKLSKLGDAGMNLFKRFVFEEPATETDNRRGEDRTPVVGEINVVVLGADGAPAGHTRAFVRDLSAQGCCLWSRVRLAVDTRLVLNFPAIDGQPPAARGATVCHSRGQNGAGFAIGCRFVAESAAA